MNKLKEYKIGKEEMKIIFLEGTWNKFIKGIEYKIDHWSPSQLWPFKICTLATHSGLEALVQGLQPEQPAVRAHFHSLM